MYPDAGVRKDGVWISIIRALESWPLLVCPDAGVEEDDIRISNMRVQFGNVAPLGSGSMHAG